MSLDLSAITTPAIGILFVIFHLILNASSIAISLPSITNAVYFGSLVILLAQKVNFSSQFIQTHFSWNVHRKYTSLTSLFTYNSYPNMILNILTFNFLASHIYTKLRTSINFIFFLPYTSIIFYFTKEVYENYFNLVQNQDLIGFSHVLYAMLGGVFFSSQEVKLDLGSFEIYPIADIYATLTKETLRMHHISILTVLYLVTMILCESNLFFIKTSSISSNVSYYVGNLMALLFGFCYTYFHDHRRESKKYY